MALHIRVVVRELLEKLFPVASDLEAYCEDRFFDACRKRWTDAMDRTAKINLLLQSIDPEQLLAELRVTHPVEVADVLSRHSSSHLTPVRRDPTDSDTPSRSTPPIPADSSYRRVPRIALADGILRTCLRRHRVATLLQTWHGGGRTLARQIAAQAKLLHDISTLWLTDYATEQSTTAEFYFLLTGERSIRDQRDYHDWLYSQVAPGGLLIVLLGTRGPELLLNQVAAVIRSYLDSRPNAMFLVVGGERLLRLRQHTNYPWLRLLPSVSFVDVPDLAVDEVTQLLMLHHSEDLLPHAALLHSLTGGHPWLLSTLIRNESSDRESAQLLIQNEIRQSKLLDRHLKDPRAQAVLRKLQAGEAVQSLQDPCIRHDPTEYAESRLYFDGLLRVDEHGRTVARVGTVNRWFQDL